MIEREPLKRYKVDLSRTIKLKPGQEAALPDSLKIVGPDGSVTCFAHEKVFDRYKMRG